MKEYIKLMRPKHYLKNFLVFLPLIFSGMLNNIGNVIDTALAFISFSIMASSIYVFNDLKDYEKDKLHEVKKNRPIASGKIKPKKALIFGIILFLASILINYVIVKTSYMPYVYILIYFIINIAYSLGLKDIPLVDISILTFGFMLRMLYGASVLNIEISAWLYLTVMAGSFYLGLGKRRNELIKTKNETRKVLKFYNKEFLDKNMYSCLTLAIVFYALWAVDKITITKIGTDKIVWTVPIILIILMRYSLDVEKDTYGDPVDVIISDKVILLIGTLYVAIMFILLYL